MKNGSGVIALDVVASTNFLARLSTRHRQLCSALPAVWPDLAIFWTLGNFLKHLATINLPKSPTFLGNFCKGVKIYHFSSEIIFGQLLQKLDDFFLVTLVTGVTCLKKFRLKISWNCAFYNSLTFLSSAANGQGFKPTSNLLPYTFS